MTMTTWQPFGTEPQDGTEFLAWREDAGVLICWWADVVDAMILRESGGDDLTTYPPTHWMPLPEGPKVSRPTCVCMQLDDVRAVRMCGSGKATTYQQDVVLLCRMCRDRMRGHWMYVDQSRKA